MQTGWWLRQTQLFGSLCCQNHRAGIEAGLERSSNPRIHEFKREGRNDRTRVSLASSTARTWWKSGSRHCEPLAWNCKFSSKLINLLDVEQIYSCVNKTDCDTAGSKQKCDTISNKKNMSIKNCKENAHNPPKIWSQPEMRMMTTESSSSASSRAGV